MISSPVSRRLAKEWKSVALVISILVIYTLYKSLSTSPPPTHILHDNVISPESADEEPVTPKEPKWVYNPTKVFPEDWYEIPKKVDPTCPAKHDLYFLRTHQTGTSSVTNIFYRYGQEHELGFVMYPLKLHLHYPARPNMRYLESVAPKNGYNILCQYTRHKKMDALRMMPEGAIFATLLRNPVDQFLSVFHNFDVKSEIRNLQQHHNPYDEFFRNPSKVLMMSSDAIFYLIQNSMSFDLGLNPTQFKEDESFIDDFIESIDKDFHLVMILELLDESLVLFRRLMCWDLKQVIYVKLSMNNDYSASISDDVRQKILDWNAIDYKLYNHFHDKMKKIIAEQDDDFHAEVAMLKKINSQFWKECYSNVHPVFNGNKIGYSLHKTHENNATCKFLATDDVTQTHIIGLKQFKDALPPSDILMVRNHMQNLRKHNPAMLAWEDVHKVLHPDSDGDLEGSKEL